MKFDGFRASYARKKKPMNFFKIFDILKDFLHCYVLLIPQINQNVCCRCQRLGEIEKEISRLLHFFMSKFHWQKENFKNEKKMSPACTIISKVKSSDQLLFGVAWGIFYFNMVWK